MSEFEAHRVGSKLWVGSVFAVEALRHEPKLSEQFGLVVLAAFEQQECTDKVKRMFVPIDDGVPTMDEKARVFEAARVVNQHRARGERVLVTCLQGRNRSALIAALALMLDGLSAKQAVYVVRACRKAPHGPVLSNPNFVKFLEEIERYRARRPASDSVSAPG